MHWLDIYKQSVEIAKQKVKEKYGLDHHDYGHDHEAHTYFLKCFDEAATKLALKS